MIEHTNTHDDAFDDECPTQITPGCDLDPPEGELVGQDEQDALLSDLLSHDDRVASTDKTGHRVLEINQVWESAILDTRHVSPSRGRVTIGNQTGYRWSLLGLDLGWVPRPLALVLPYAPPMWSEIETRPRADFVTANEEGEQDLFRFSGGRWVADVREGWTGFVEREGERTTFQAGATVALADGDVFMAERDGVVFHARTVPQSKRVALGLFSAIDWFFLGLLGLVGVFALAFALLVAFLPSPPLSEALEIDDKFAEVFLNMQKKEKVVQPKTKLAVASKPKAKGREGKRGVKEAKMQRAKGAAKAQEARMVAENAGALGFLAKMGGADGMGGSVDPASLDGIGGLIGAKGAQIGRNGLGSRGSSLGGGGDAEGLGGMCAQPPCGNGTAAAGLAFGVDGGTKRDGVIKAAGKDAIIIGALDRSQIEKVIKQHVSQIRYCYQRQLQRHPGLQGKMVSRFVIAKDGTVSSSSTPRSSIGNAAVSSCVEGKISAMQFPKPRGGGIVVVSYPFMFSGG